MRLPRVCLRVPASLRTRRRLGRVWRGGKHTRKGGRNTGTAAQGYVSLWGKQELGDEMGAIVVTCQYSLSNTTSASSED